MARVSGESAGVVLNVRPAHTRAVNRFSRRVRDKLRRETREEKNTFPGWVPFQTAKGIHRVYRLASRHRRFHRFGNELPPWLFLDFPKDHPDPGEDEA